jgi:hypothetical protein
MGHSKAEKAKTHRRIVAIASKRFREGGLGGDRNRRDDEGSRFYGRRVLQALCIA